jgi:uncharacterized membrane-anchored protein
MNDRLRVQNRISMIQKSATLAGIILLFILPLSLRESMALGQEQEVALELGETPEQFLEDGEQVVEQELDAATMVLIERYNSIQWQEGPVKVQIGTMGEIEVPAGYQFASDTHAQTLLEVYGNPRNPNILGAVVPTSEEENWTLIFQFDAVGYIKDADRESIDAEEILSGFQSGLPAMNQQRRAIGSSECRGISWTEKPFYDAQTNNLTWALNLAFDEGNAINYDIRMLGRHGVMEATILGDPATYAQAVPKVKQLLTSYAFTSGNKYSEWTQGDKVAAIGLTGLVAGGGLAVAAKTGFLAKIGLLLAKGGKGIILAIVVAFGAFGSFIKKLFGGGRGETYSE